MASIRIIQPTYDKNTKQHYKVGDILDLGGIRNKKAVDSKQAVWVDSEKLSKAESKGEDTTNMSEKVEVPRGAKKTTSSARGKKIETKNPDYSNMISVNEHKKAKEDNKKGDSDAK